MLLWDKSEGLEYWAPIHAWRILGQLGAKQAIETLVDLFNPLELCDWAGEELPHVMAMIGPDSIPALRDHLFDKKRPEFSRVTANESIEKIGIKYEAYKQQCIDILSEFLEQSDASVDSLNGLVISSLVDLKATNAINTIRMAFYREIVCEGVVGDLEDVEIRMGIRAEREAPKPRYWQFKEAALETYNRGKLMESVWSRLTNSEREKIIRLANGAGHLGL